MIDEIYKFFAGHPLFNLTSLIVGIIGIILGFYFYIKSQKNKNPIYAVKTINLVKEKVQKISTIQILHLGSIISNLSVTKIALWNSGKDTISISDVAKNNSLRVVINPEFEILDIQILFQKNTSNDFKLIIPEDKKCVYIDFYFFDFEEGIVLQLLHTGTNSEQITVEGQIKSVQKILRKQFDTLSIQQKTFSFLFKFFKLNKQIINTQLIYGLAWIILGWGLLGTSILIYAIFTPNYNISTSPVLISMIIPQLLSLNFSWIWSRKSKYSKRI